MVFNSGWVAGVARVSAELCQYVACNPERLSAEEALEILCCLPLHHLRRLALCLFSFFCFPPFPYPDLRPPPRRRSYRRSFSSSSSSSSFSSSDDDYVYDSHSD